MWPFRELTNELLAQGLKKKGLAYRAGRGDEAVYRIAPDSDFEDPQARERSADFVVWLYVFRDGPASLERVAEQTGEVGVQRDGGQLVLSLHWAGNRHTELTVKKRATPVGSKAQVSLTKLVAELALT